MTRAAPRRVRKTVFGRDPGAYDRSRLPYPSRVFALLTNRCGLGPGTAVFEIGPGTGIATSELLRLGANPLTLIEADARLARFLADRLAPFAGAVTISNQAFERAPLSRGAFDLGVAASSFHWLPERRALRKIARVLRPGGWWATWNNHHGDPYRTSPFHDALQPLYEVLDGGRGQRYTKAVAAKDRRERLLALRSVGEFEQISREDIRWTARLTTAQVRSLWGTFSDIMTRPPARRRWFLRELARTVDERFGGTVEFPVLTPIYTARRR